MFLSGSTLLQNLVTKLSLVRKAALRFFAGESLDDAIAAAKKLNKLGFSVTLDQLGEDTNTYEEAKQTTKEIIEILDGIHEENVRSNISIKLTQLGITVNEALCIENLKQILEHAKTLNIFVRIDMEDSGIVDATFRVYQKMEDSGFDNVGLVLQSYLYRTLDDLIDLLKSNTRIRIVKGAYKESPTIAFPKKSDVDNCFDEITRSLIEKSAEIGSPKIDDEGKWPPIPAIATHDEKRIAYAKSLVEKIELPKEKIEFQMLYGIRQNLQNSLVQQGYPVRIYVPFGTQWYPYFMRRLAERPANLWFFISSLFRK